MEHKIKCLGELLQEYLLNLQNSVGLEATGISDDAYNDSCKVRTGYSSEFIRDFIKGTLTLVGGRSSTCTHFAINLAVKASLSHHNSVALFVKDLTVTDILTNIIASKGKIDALSLQNGKISKEHITMVKAVADNISTRDLSTNKDVYVPMPTNLFIDTSYYNSSSDLFEKCSKIKHETGGGLNLVILDDIDLLILKKDEEHLNASMILKQLARELNVPIIVTCGLTRDRIENAHNKRPFITDLRPPAYEEHADSVILLHRDAYYDVAVENNILELIVNKNVPGKPTGTVRFSWDPKYLRMDEIKQEVI